MTQQKTEEKSNIEEILSVKNIDDLYNDNQAITLLGIMIGAFLPYIWLVRKITTPIIKKIASYKGNDSMYIFNRYNVNKRVTHIFTLFYLMFWSSVFIDSGYFTKFMIKAQELFITLYTIFVITTTINMLVSVSVDMYKTKAISKRLSIDLHAQIFRLVIVLCSFLSVISLLFSLSLSTLFTSVGAAAALLTFVFKDTMLGLLASLQLTYQDIIKVGDWVTLPSYSADGNIEKITITVIKIRNFDNTYTTVPTYAFLTTGVVNWRSMFENGGRRIKRSVSLDMDKIKIYKKEELHELASKPFMKKFFAENKHMLQEDNSITNITIFRHYVRFYLNNHKDIHKDGFTFLVRQLEPNEKGVPIELYVFTKDTAWTNYESIQADIFDHILAIVPQLDLRVFQTVYKLK